LGLGLVDLSLRNAKLVGTAEVDGVHPAQHDAGAGADPVLEGDAEKVKAEYPLLRALPLQPIEVRAVLDRRWSAPVSQTAAKFTRLAQSSCSGPAIGPPMTSAGPRRANFHRTHHSRSSPMRNPPTRHIPVAGARPSTLADRYPVFVLLGGMYFIFITGAPSIVDYWAPGLPLAQSLIWYANVTVWLTCFGMLIHHWIDRKNRTLAGEVALSLAAAVLVTLLTFVLARSMSWSLLDTLAACATVDLVLLPRIGRLVRAVRQWGRRVRRQAREGRSG
jgi:hypothetical protein